MQDLTPFSPDPLFPPDWRDDPPPSLTAEIGDEWLESGVSLALAVPSLIVPEQHNVLLNPQHVDFRAVADKATSFPFQFDMRLSVRLGTTPTRED
jgi:RES domain-containing protein